MKSETNIRSAAPVTHPDWMMRPGAIWGPEGLHRMLDDCKACGWSRVYWRTRDGGRALYNSGVMDPGSNYDEDSFWTPQTPEDQKLYDVTMDGIDVTTEWAKGIYEKYNRLDYSGLDSLAEAVKYGHEIGIEVHAWISINEEDHAWGLTSRYTRAHPEYRWRRRDGSFYRSQISFAYEDARAYLLEIIRETVENYDVDGVFIDWIRTGDIRDNPQTDEDGVANYRYEVPLVEGFKVEYGIDPHELPNGDMRWVRHRAEPQTEFMRSVRKLVKSTKPNLPVSVLVAHPWCFRGFNDKIDGNLRGMLLDVSTWSREGLIDEAVAVGNCLGDGTPEKAYEALKEETEGKVSLWSYAWMPSSISDVERDYEVAKRLGAKHILFWEADHLALRPNKEELQRVMWEHSRMQHKDK